MRLNDLSPDLLLWSPDAEASVLGSLLLDNSAWDRVGDLLQEKHFHTPAHAAIFSAIASLVVGGKPADPITVFDRLQHLGKADEAGGFEYVASLSLREMSAAGVRRYAEIVAERALMRGMVEGAEKVKELAVAPGISIADRLDQAQNVLQALQIGQGRLMPTPIQDTVLRLIDRVQDVADGKKVPCVSTGILGLDLMMGGGFKGGKQVILAARPSIGKSSLGLKLCLNVSLAGHGAAFLSQEMSKDEQTDRATANLGRIALDNVISGRLDKEEWTRFTEAIERMRSLPLYLDDQPALTLSDIRAKARMLKRQFDVKLIVIDYLQLCAASSSKTQDNRHHQLEELSRGLKNLARQLDITILSLSQLNREVEKRANGKPVLSDLKESGAIEEDADIVMLMSRGSVSPNGVQLVNCSIPKNRQGRVGEICFAFTGQFQEWQETVAPPELKTAPRKHYTEDV
jgi:replicative DNA helicase